MTWRTWAMQTLRAYAPLTALVPASAMIGHGALFGRPTLVPFIVVGMGPDFTGPFPGVSEQELFVHVHDDPGDYMKIDDILKQVRVALMGEDVTTSRNAIGMIGGVACSWDSDSRDLSDDALKTIYKTASFTLRGRKSAYA